MVPASGAERPDRARSRDEPANRVRAPRERKIIEITTSADEPPRTAMDPAHPADEPPRTAMDPAHPAAEPARYRGGSGSSASTWCPAGPKHVTTSREVKLEPSESSTRIPYTPGRLPAADRTRWPTCSHIRADLVPAPSTFLLSAESERPAGEAEVRNAASRARATPTSPHQVRPFGFSFDIATGDRGALCVVSGGRAAHVRACLRVADVAAALAGCRLRRYWLTGKSVGN